MKINLINNTKLKTFFYGINLAKNLRKVDSLFMNKTECTLVITNNTEIQKLNNEFRNIDSPTNVLSFELPDNNYLGDIIISVDKIKQESKLQNKNINNHFIHLLIHGILHLQGFDHMNNNDATKMEKKEVELLKKLHLPNPYID